MEIAPVIYRSSKIILLHIIPSSAPCKALTLSQSTQLNSASFARALVESLPWMTTARPLFLYSETVSRCDLDFGRLLYSLVYIAPTLCTPLNAQCFPRLFRAEVWKTNLSTMLLQYRTLFLLPILTFLHSSISIQIWPTTQYLPATLPAACLTALTANISCTPELITASSVALQVPLSSALLTSYCTTSCYSSLKASIRCIT